MEQKWKTVFILCTPKAVNSSGVIRCWSSVLAREALTCSTSSQSKCREGKRKDGFHQAAWQTLDKSSLNVMYVSNASNVLVPVRRKTKESSSATWRLLFTNVSRWGPCGGQNPLHLSVVASLPVFPALILPESRLPPQRLPRRGEEMRGVRWRWEIRNKSSARTEPGRVVVLQEACLERLEHESTRCSLASPPLNHILPSICRWITGSFWEQCSSWNAGRS